MKDHDMPIFKASPSYNQSMNNVVDISYRRMSEKNRIFIMYCIAHLVLKQLDTEGVDVISVLGQGDESSVQIAMEGWVERTLPQTWPGNTHVVFGRVDELVELAREKLESFCEPVK